MFKNIWPKKIQNNNKQNPSYNIKPKTSSSDNFKSQGRYTATKNDGSPHDKVKGNFTYLWFTIITEIIYLLKQSRIDLVENSQGPS